MTDLASFLTALRTANAKEAQAIWRLAQKHGLTERLERAYAFGSNGER